MRFFDSKLMFATAMMYMVLSGFDLCSSFQISVLTATSFRRSSSRALTSSSLPQVSKSEQLGTQTLISVPDVSTESLVPIFPLKSTQKLDGIWEKMCIFLLSWSLACVSYDKHDAMKYVYPGMGYSQFVSVSRTLLRGTAEDIKNKIVNVLLSLIPVKLRTEIYEYCKGKPRWIAEKSSEFMSFGLLHWLVGPVARILIDVPQDDGSTEEWLSGVKLTECRYLVESGCKSACLHLCKGPTQSFFNDHLGIKVHFKPDFNDCSCEMLFGIAAPTPAADPAYGEPCFSTCSMNAMKRPKSKDTNTASSNDAKFNRCS